MVVEPTHAVERLRQKLQKHPSICLYWATGHHLVLQRVCERTVQAERHQVSILTNIYIYQTGSPTSYRTSSGQFCMYFNEYIFLVRTTMSHPV